MILDIHLHSFFSDGIHSPAEMAAQVKKLGLDGFALVDHDTVKGHRAAKEAAKRLKLKFIPGIEVSSKEGHIIGLFIEQEIEKGLSAEETVQRIHDLGGVAIAAHPYDLFRPSTGDLLKKTKFDYIELNSRAPLPIFNYRVQGMANGLNLNLLACSDAHAIEEVGYGTVCVNTLNDLKKGKAKIARFRWAGPWLVLYGKIRRVLRKHGLY